MSESRRPARERRRRFYIRSKTSADDPLWPWRLGSDAIRSISLSRGSAQHSGELAKIATEAPFLRLASTLRPRRCLRHHSRVYCAQREQDVGGWRPRQDMNKAPVLAPGLLPTVSCSIKS